MRTSLAFVCLAGLIACGGESTPAPPATPSSPAAAEPTTFAAQVTLGQKLYGESCASCHGAAGEGGKAPRVVGLDKGALPLDPPATSKYRKTQFKTAADVAEFVVKNMPPQAAGSLKESEYWAILAFDLHANGVDLPTMLDGSHAKDVVLHK
jgi:S-disulfanyl-L-cysteine oxidoreductase SoxD